MRVTTTYRTVRKRVASLKPSPENESLYREVTSDDPDIQRSAESIRDRGLHEPLIITRDNYIVSGHRRHAALKLIKQQQAPCRVLDVRRDELDRDAFIALLRDHNRQRNKSSLEAIRESLIHVDPEQAVVNLQLRRSQAINRHYDSAVPEFALTGRKRRYRISWMKADHVKYVKKVIFEDRRQYWPLPVRAVHYPLLNYQFFRNLRDKTRYRNDQNFYEKTSDLLTRLRLEGEIPWSAICDETRPVTLYNAFDDVRQFIAYESNRFLDGYWLDLLQSQPAHVEIMIEKNTVRAMVDNATRKYQVTTFSARGFNEIDSLYELSQRYRNSGKEALRLIVLSDFDPEGERIANNAGITLRDEFGVDDVKVFKAGVTPGQIEKYDLPPDNLAKEKSSNLQWFLERTGGDPTVYELEALDPADMLRNLDECVRGIIDVDLYNAEVAKEREDAGELERVRRVAQQILKGAV